jgi:creatinine amidohydrolase
MKQTLAGIAAAAGVAAALAAAQPAPRGVALADLTWADAEPMLTSSAVVVIPLGAGALEQGMHMKLNADERLARHLASRAQAASSVVVAPGLNYHFYPAYADYPGSTSLTETSAKTMMVDAVRSLARFGPRRFYVINTSPSTLAPLFAAANTLSADGILLGYTDPDHWTRRASVLKQTPIAVGHAEEAATSMMLFVDPSAVDMTKAKREYAAGRGALTRQDAGNGVVSKSGTLGDATLATAEKGRTLVDALLAGILDDIDKIRSAPLPVARTAPPPAPAPRPAGAPRPGSDDRRAPNGCLPDDERVIRAIAARFTYNWSQQDALAISLMFTSNGDIRHPDGSIERGREVIMTNRTQLFMRREYRGSKHPLQLNDVRCLNNDMALADGKWELRLDDTPQATPGRGLGVTQINAGWCTLVVQKIDAGWFIEAWRYTVNPPEGAPAPVLLSKPGYVGRGGG